LLLFALQRHFLFPIPGKDREAPPPLDARVLHLPTQGGETEAWYLPPLRSEPGKKHPLLLYAHGNATLMDQTAGDFGPPRSWGVGVLLVEYPGYGRSGGSPSQQSITDTFCRAYDWALQQPEIDPQRIIGHGRSLGGGAICQLARHRDLAALILESTFTSTRPFAARFGAPGFLIRDPFDNEAVLKALNRPVLVFHGDEDTVVPFAHGLRLAKVAGAKFVPRQGGHNDLPRPWEEIRPFLLSQGLIQP